MTRTVRSHAVRRPAVRCGAIGIELVAARAGVALLLVVMLVGLVCRPVTAQALLPEEEAQQLGKSKEKKQPFVLIAAKPETLEALDDFRRAIRKAQWDKAFSQIDKLLAETSTGLVPAKEGLLVPLRSAVAIDLAALPPAGQEAYRLFHDAEARKLWEAVQKETGAEELNKLSRLATLELITSVGDLAADRWGDALFEQGDLLGAVDAWQRVLNYRPDSKLSRAQLLAKVGIALADAARWPELDEVARELKERHAGESVTVGGAKVVAADHIAALIAARQATPEAAAGRLPADLVLSDDVEPVWQFHFEAKDPQAHHVIQRWNMWGMFESIDLFNLPIAAATSETMLYANWMGCDFAIDLANGKMKWRNGRFHDLAQKMRQGNMFLSSDQYAIAVDGDDVWAVVQPNQQDQNQNNQMMNGRQQGNMLHVVRRDPANGKELFRSSQVEGLKEFRLLGTPVPVGHTLYLTASKLNQPSELHVVAVQTDTNRVQWSTHLGTYQFVPGQGYGTTVKPTMLAEGPRLYVDTHAGGLVEMESGSGTVRWACNYPSKMPGQQNMMFRFWWDEIEPETGFGPSGPLALGGRLLIKGMQSPRLVSLRPDGSALEWKRSVPDNAMLAGADDDRVYLASEELLAFDLKTQRLLWVNALPFKSKAIVPLVTQHRYYQFTPRGIYEVDKVTGEVVKLFRGADREGGGGAILTTRELLITVSPQAITAYPLKTAAADVAGK